MDPNFNIRTGIQSTLYHLYTIWLFTFSDLKTIIIPSTVSAILHKAGSYSFGLDDQEDTLILSGIPVILVAVWAWINILPFVIDNQRRPDSIEEDKLNKAWRPLSASRLTPQQATKLMFLLYPAAILISIHLRVSLQSLALVAMGIWYNELGGSDAFFLVRNMLCACMIVCYTSGALQILLQQSIYTNTTLVTWFAIIGLVVFTTVHIQDMHDQVGDSQRGRRTIPLVFGDGFARWTNALPIMFWSWFCPYFWKSSTFGYLGPVLIGSTIAYRTLVKRTLPEDKATFRMWNMWMTSLYSLPLLACMAL